MLLLTSCGGRKALNIEQFMAAMNAEPYTSEIVSGPLTYRISLVPPMLMAAPAVAAGGPHAYNARLAQISGNTYFRIRIYDSRKDDLLADKTIKPDKFLFYEQEAKKHFTLITDSGSSLEPSYISYEDNSGLAPYETVLVCFDYSLADAGLQLKYDDQLNGVNSIYYRLKATDVRYLPILKI